MLFQIHLSDISFLWPNIDIKERERLLPLFNVYIWLGGIITPSFSRLLTWLLTWKVRLITFHMSKKIFMTNFLAKGGSLVTAMSITWNRDTVNWRYIVTGI